MLSAPLQHYCHKLNQSPPLKRSFDVILSLAGIVLLSPVLLACAAAIAADSPGGVFFTQTRVGLRHKPFRIYKLRTMHTTPGHVLLTSSNDDRITAAGALLRRWKLDEIPQLLNVLKGDMSLVGPRPEVPRYVAHYGARDVALIFSVRPGITDFASLRFIDEEQLLAASPDPEKTYLEHIMPKKLAYYRFYVRKRSFTLDMYLIIQTLRAVFPRRPVKREKIVKIAVKS